MCMCVCVCVLIINVWVLVDRLGEEEGRESSIYVRVCAREREIAVCVRV